MGQDQMPRSLFVSPFPKLALTENEKLDIVHTVDAIVTEAVDQYEQYLYTNHRKLDPSLWSYVKSREDVRVYHSKLPGGGTPDERMQLVFMLGSIVGNFNDVSYGVRSQSTDEMRIKTAYTQDTLFDDAILENIVQPTPERPFETVVLRWAAKAVPFYYRAVTKHRDSIYIEATGVRKLDNGEHIGYNLLQSTVFPNSPPLPQYERSHLSFCTLWRQASPGRVQIITRAFGLFEKEMALPALMIRAIADMLVAVWKIVPCAQRKKLAWLVQNRSSITMQRPFSLANSVSSSTTSSSGYTPTNGRAGSCGVCEASLSTSRLGLKYCCAVCAQPTCKKCCVDHPLAFLTPDGQLVQRKTRFCVSCMATTSRMDAEIVARDEIVTRQCGGSRETEAALALERSFIAGRTSGFV